MMHTHLRDISLTVFLLACAACSKQHVQVQRLRPAPLFVGDYRTVGVATFDGEYGDEVADLLDDTLQKQRHNRLINRSRIAAEQMQVATLGASTVHAKELAQRVGADVVLFGRVQEFPRERKEIVTLTPARTSQNDDGSTNHHPGSYTWTRRANLDVIVDLKAVDMRGTLIGASQFTISSRVQEESSAYGSFSAVDWELHRREAFTAVPTHFRRHITPFKQNEIITLYSSSSIPESKRAVQAVRDGDWALATALYREGVRRIDEKGGAKHRSRAHYNLGIALAYAGEFNEGLTHLQVAHDLRPSKDLEKIIAAAAIYAQETALARHQLDVLGGRVPFIEFTPPEHERVVPIEPWDHDDAQLES